VLKKAGIVAAITAACALSVSPLAFAGDFKGDSDHKSDHKSHHRVHHNSKSHDDSDCRQDNSIDNSADQGHDNTNFLNIQNNTLQVDPQVCDNPVLSGNAVSALFGKAKSISKNG
jgi:hypothetical protein